MWLLTAEGLCADNALPAWGRLQGGKYAERSLSWTPLYKGEFYGKVYRHKAAIKKILKNRTMLVIQ